MRNPFKKKYSPPLQYFGSGMSWADFHKKVKELVGQPFEIAINERNTSGVLSALSTVPLDMYLAMDNVEAYIEEKHKPGTYTLSIRNMDKVTVCTTTIGVGRVTSKKSDDNSEKATGQSSQLGMPPQLFELFKMMVEKQNGGNKAEDLKTLVELQKTLSTNPMVEKVLEVAYSNMLAPQSDPIENFRALMQVAREVNPPHIEPQDPMSALFSQIGPLLTLFLAGKQGGMPALAGLMPNNTNTSPTQALSSALPPGDNVSSLAAGQMAGTPPSHHRPLMDQPASAPVHELSAHELYYRAWIQPLTMMVSNKIDPVQIASHIISMITYAINFSSSDPHPLVKDMVDSISSQHLETLEDGLKYLFGNIEALNKDATLQEAIKKSLMIQLSYFYQNLSGDEFGDEELEGTPEEIEITDEVKDGESAIVQNIANGGGIETK